MLAVSLLAASLLSTQSCGLAAAKAQIKSSRLTIPASQSISSEPYRVEPAQADQVICFDLTRDKTEDLAVTIANGGTAGDIDWVVFVGTAHGYRLALVRGGYKLALGRVSSDLVETDPVYRKDDPNCCPTGGFDHTRWRWKGQKFAVVRTWHNRSYKP